MATQKKKTGTSSASSQSTVNHTTVVVMNGDGNSAGTGARPRRRRKKQSPTEKLKRKIAQVTGIPTTASGRKKKAERVVANFLMDKIDQLTGKKTDGK